MRFQVHNYEHDNEFRWPGAQWIFKDQSEEGSLDSLESSSRASGRPQTFMAKDHDHVAHHWTTKSPNSYPYANQTIFLNKEELNVTTDSSGDVRQGTGDGTTNTVNLTIEGYANVNYDLVYKEFGHSMLEVNFYQNPVSVWYQKQDFKHWVLDQCADLGGFLIFCLIIFGVPCVAIQTRLY